MSVPKLTYFNLPGRAFGVRVAMFKAFGKDCWKDERIEFQDWKELKPTTPLGSLPVLTLPDGKQIAQSEALTRWAGKQCGLYPENDLAALLVDEACATAGEAISKAPQNKDPEEKKKLREEYAEGFLKTALELFSKRLNECGPFLLGNDISIGDLYIYMVTDMIATGNMDYIDAKYLDNFPSLQLHQKNVKNSPLLTSYLAEYPN